MLIVALRKLTDAQKNNIKQHYKTIVFDKRLHIRKSIEKLVCEVLIVEIDLSRVFSISKNIVLKWLKSQDITNVVTSFIYESSKYKKLFDKHVNYFVRSFPELFRKNIEEEIKTKELTDDRIKSKFEPNNSSSREVKESEPSEETGTETSTEVLSESSEGTVDNRIEIIEKRLKALEKLVISDSLFDSPFRRRGEEQLTKSKEEKKKKQYTMEEKTDKIVICENGVEVQKYEFKSKIQKRKLMKTAQKYFDYLTSPLSEEE